MSRALVVAVLLGGCGRIGFDPLPAVLTTSPLGGAWNQYALADDVTVPCDTSRADLGWSDCVHLGTYRTLEITTDAACDDLTVTDELDALQWGCLSIPSGVRIYGKGLHPDARLRDLIDGTTWRANRLTVSRAGVVLAQTMMDAWWTNPIAPLPDNRTGGLVALDQPETIYVLAEPRTTGGYDITADGVAIVALDGGALITDPAISALCIDGVRQCTTRATGRHRLWIELTHDETSSSQDYGIGWTDVAMSVVWEVRELARNASTPVELDASRGNRISNVLAQRTNYAAVKVSRSTRNLIERVTQSNGYNATIQLTDGSDDNLVRDITAHHDDGPSVEVVNSSRNQFAKLRIARSEGCGIDITDGHDSRITDSITIENDGPGLCVSGGTRNTFSNILVAGNGVEFRSGSTDNVLTDAVIASPEWDDAISVLDSSRNTFAFVTIASSQSDGIYISGSDDTTMLGMVVANVATNGVSVNSSARPPARPSSRVDSRAIPVPD